MFVAACSVYDNEPNRPVLPEGAVTGTDVSIEEAEKNLISFLSGEPMTRSGKTRAIASKFSLGGVVTRADGETEEEPFVHVFNFDDNEGFAILSGDRRTSPILCVIDKGTLNEDTVVDDPGFAMMLSELDTYYRIKTGLPVTDIYGNRGIVVDPDPDISRPDEYYVYGEWETLADTGTILECEWDQNKPFNEHCVTDYGASAAVGCGPIAVAQIMYHWGKNVRYNDVYYDWSKMRKIKNYKASISLTEEWFLVKRLLRVLGTPDNLGASYGEDESGTSRLNLVRTFENFSYVSGGTLEDYDFSKLLDNLAYGPAIGTGSAIKIVTTTKKLGIFVTTHTKYSGSHCWVFDRAYSKRRAVTKYEKGASEKTYYEYQNMVHMNLGQGSEGRTDTYYNGYYISTRFDTRNGPVTRGTSTDTLGVKKYYRYNLKMNCGIRAY